MDIFLARQATNRTHNTEKENHGQMDVWLDGVSAVRHGPDQ